MANSFFKLLLFLTRLFKKRKLEEPHFSQLQFFSFSPRKGAAFCQWYLPSGYADSVGSRQVNSEVSSLVYLGLC